MKKKPELDDIDVVFDPAPLTKEEKNRLSKYIQRDKFKQRKKQSSRQRIGALTSK